MSAIPQEIRRMYSLLAEVIGRQIASREKANEERQNDSRGREFAKQDARGIVEIITALREAISDGRNFETLRNILEKGLRPSQLAWVLEAYFLLNQSSVASAEIVSKAAIETDSSFANKIINGFRDLNRQDLKRLLEEQFSANLVLTSHPTAGIQKDYQRHITDLLSILGSIPNLRAFLDLFKSESPEVAETLEKIETAISHMVRAKPYNERSLTPSDESRDFLTNITKAVEIIPNILGSLESALKRKYGADFVLAPEFFGIATWVARDIDGNPKVSAEEHLKSIKQERLFFLNIYLKAAQELQSRLSDDFSEEEGIPSKTIFSSPKFKVAYDEIKFKYGAEIPNKHQAYRVLLEYLVIRPLKDAIEALSTQDRLPDFSVQEQLIKPLELIRANKEGLYTEEIDSLIRKARVFGDFGAKGHTRQGAHILAGLMTMFSSLGVSGAVGDKTNFVLSDTKTVNEHIATLTQKISVADRNHKNIILMQQSLDLLRLFKLGGIQRQIISMNGSFEDMLNVLVIAKCLGAFSPASDGTLPSSKLEIVPLTERISDLQNSHQCTLDALLNPAWRQYLISQGGRFIKMRGPSDSGKQNGFIAAQWEMFKSKTQDSLVVHAFNACLSAFVFDDNRDLDTMSKLPDPLAKRVLVSFVKMFRGMTSEEKQLWVQSKTREIRLVNFDGWGEPIERGGGLDFKDTVNFTQPLASSPAYERTVQGGGSQQFTSAPRTRRAIKEFLQGLLEHATRSILKRKQAPDQYFASLSLEPSFASTMDKFSTVLRTSLRNNVLGLDAESDDICSSEINLRLYFQHVIKSPLIYLDLFNIASRPTSRSGSQIKERLEQYDFDLDRFARELPVPEILTILADIRAIPYAAMFNLLGGNHVSFYGFADLDEDTIASLKQFYKLNDSSQEHLLLKHMIDSLEKGLFTMDISCYAAAHSIIQQATDPRYEVSQDPLIKRLVEAEAAARTFVAKIKGYPNTQNLRLEDLLVHDPETRDLLIARRNDAVIPRMGLAVVMSKIIRDAKAGAVNPLDPTAISPSNLDLLRKAFVAGASTFGTGCID